MQDLNSVKVSISYRHHSKLFESDFDVVVASKNVKINYSNSKNFNANTQKAIDNVAKKITGTITVKDLNDANELSEKISSIINDKSINILVQKD